ncbi:MULTISPECIES: hypothetical protein [Pseudomonas]|nr:MULTISPECIES: hypothetical protein [Pseudomonas]QXI25005.1 hypothetical protein HU724_012245 [Pseudomonas iranensis]
MRIDKNLSFPSSLGVAPGLQFLLGCAIFAGGTLILMNELAATFFTM